MAAQAGEQAGDGKGARRPRTLPEDQKKGTQSVNLFRWQIEKLRATATGMAFAGVEDTTSVSDLIRRLLSHDVIDPLHEIYAAKGR